MFSVNRYGDIVHRLLNMRREEFLTKFNYIEVKNLYYLCHPGGKMNLREYVKELVI